MFREMFSQLVHEATTRTSGQTSHADFSEMAWGFLQGEKLADDLVNLDFDGHHIMPHVLNHHIVQDV